MQPVETLALLAHVATAMRQICEASVVARSGEPMRARALIGEARARLEAALHEIRQELN